MQSETTICKALHNSGMILIFFVGWAPDPEGVYFHSRRDTPQ
ncbi:hypothetical protein MicvaDRAFT_4299 [Microcoleus vaginatus FGP-2]|nr:hypothetical protein MicvaDRAFT_4299 [Microcoleus vaginatus FGP-2]